MDQYGLFDKLIKKKKKRLTAKALLKSCQGKVGHLPTGTESSTTKDIDQTDVGAEAAPIPSELGFSNVAIQNVVSLKSQENDGDETRMIDDNSGDSQPKGFRCNVCHGIISGFRYRCCSCADFDMCSSCEARGVHPLHYVLRVPGFCPSSEVREVIAAVRLALTRPNTIKTFIETNNAKEAIDPLDDDSTITISPPNTDYDPTNDDPFNLLTPKKQKKTKPKLIKLDYSPKKRRANPKKVPKKVKIEYSYQNQCTNLFLPPLRKKKLPKELKTEYLAEKLRTKPPPLRKNKLPKELKIEHLAENLCTNFPQQRKKKLPKEIKIEPENQCTNPAPLKPLSSTSLVPNAPDINRIPLKQFTKPPPLTPFKQYANPTLLRRLSSTTLVSDAPDVNKVPLALKKLPANMIPPPNAVIKKIRMAPQGRKPVKLKLIGKRNFSVALDAVRKKAAVRLRPLPKNIKEGVRIIIPDHYDKTFY